MSIKHAAYFYCTVKFLGGCRRLFPANKILAKEIEKGQRILENSVAILRERETKAVAEVAIDKYR